jgi:FAD/FMN-containing dehydrogenase
LSDFAVKWNNRATRRKQPEMTELNRLPDFMRHETVSMLVGSVDTQCTVAYPANEQQCRETLDFCREDGLTVCPRGSGRSYGDAILNDGQVLLDMRHMNRILAFDSDSGRVSVEAGTRIIDILLEYHHLGYTVPASPTDSTIWSASS